MRTNMYWPIYLKLQNELKELSYHITIDKRQLKTYSITIADLILRTAAECENIASTLCKREGIKFKDKKGHIRKSVYFNEYIEELNKIFGLDEKYISVSYINISQDAFDCKIIPLRKEKMKVSGKEKEMIPWYNAYNKIKHDREKNFKLANIENLIMALAALFLLNIYLKNQTIYCVSEYDYKQVITQIECFSDVFQVDYTVKVNQDEYFDLHNKDSFFDPLSYFKIALPSSTYVIERDKEIKTDSDRGADLMDKLESKVCYMQPDGKLVPKYQEYNLTDHRTICKIVAYVNRS